MTEEEWLSGTDPEPMLLFVRERTTDRKLRLSACAACRRIWSDLTHNRYRRMIEMGEFRADGRAGPREVARAIEDGIRAGMEWLRRREERSDEVWLMRRASNAICATVAHDIASVIAPAVAEAACAEGIAGIIHGRAAKPEDGEFTRYFAALLVPYCRLVRDIFGNPFRSVTPDPSWLTPTVLALAEAIYAERAFDRLPVLADALEEGGCNNGDVLSHCRGEGPHARGCWVVDLMLGKE